MTDNENLATLENALYMKFDGTFGPNPTPSRAAALQVTSSSMCANGYTDMFLCFTRDS